MLMPCFRERTMVSWRERQIEMGAANKVGDWVFKGFTATLGVATIYLTATFSVNVYRGLSWHNSQSKLNNEEPNDQKTAA